MRLLVLLFFAAILTLPNPALAERNRQSLCFNQNTDKISVKRRCRTKRNEVKLSGSNLTDLLGIEGPRGEKGAKGDPGDTGESPTMYFAAVDKDQTIISQSQSLVSVEQLGDPVFAGYRLTFNGDLNGCVPVASHATYNDDDYDGSPYSLVARIDTTDTSQVLVSPTVTGNFERRSFNLAVFCP